MRVRCIKNDIYVVSLTVGQRYDAEPEEGLYRIVDDTGKSYLFPPEF